MLCHTPCRTWRRAHVRSVPPSTSTNPSLEEKWAKESSRSQRRLRFDDYLAEDLIIRLLRQQRSGRLGDEEGSDEDYGEEAD